MGVDVRDVIGPKEDVARVLAVLLPQRQLVGFEAMLVGFVPRVHIANGWVDYVWMDECGGPCEIEGVRAPSSSTHRGWPAKVGKRMVPKTNQTLVRKPNQTLPHSRRHASYVCRVGCAVAAQDAHGPAPVY